MYALTKCPPPGADDGENAARGETSASGQQQQQQQPPPPPPENQTPDNERLSTSGSDADESVIDSGPVFAFASNHYRFKRNVTRPGGPPDVSKMSKNTVNFLNLSFIENNFKSLGLTRHVDKNFVMEAQLEFESLEKWYDRNSSFGASKKFMSNLRLPLFCHLYLNLLTKDNCRRLCKLLDLFKHLFLSPKGVELLEELKSVKNPEDNLPPCLAFLRKGKFVYLVSAEFMFHLNGFFKNHYLLKSVFQEWFDIFFIDNTDPYVIYDEYYSKTLAKINNMLRANTPKQNNNEVINGFGANLIKKKLNSSQNQNIGPSATTDSEENKSNSTQNKNNSPLISVSETNFCDDQRPSTSKEHQNISHQEPGSSKDQSNDEEVINCDDSENTKTKHSNSTKSRIKKPTEDPEAPIDPLVKSQSKKKREKKKHKKHRRSRSSSCEQELKSHKKRRSVKDNNSSQYEGSVMDCQENKNTSESNSTNHEKPERILLRFSRKEECFVIVKNKKNDKTKDSNSEKSIKEEQKMTEADEMQQERLKNSSTDEKICSSSNENSSTTSEDTFEDSFSDISLFDDEAEMRDFVKCKQKSSQNCLPFQTSQPTQFENLTKVDVRHLEEDSDLCTTRQITLTNCGKLSCTILTADHVYVAAGSIDSMVYLWERSDVATLLQQSFDAMNNIDERMKKNLNFVPPEQIKNFNEVLDRSKAFVLRGHGGAIFDLAEIPTAKILLTASNDKTFRAWNLESKVCLEVYNAIDHNLWCIAACPFTLQIATGSCDGSSCLWYLDYKRPLRMFVGHSDDILVVKFHPNRALLATGSSDKTVRVFELTSGDSLRIFIGHTDYVSCLEFHVQKPDLLVSACRSEIILWNIPSGLQLWKLKVGKVAFSSLSWLSVDILLASSVTGIVLKCDVTKNYLNSTKKIQGFSTSFDRLMSMHVVDQIVYTIGVPDKATAQKSSLKHKTKSSIRSRNEQLPSTKIFFPRHIIENNGRPMSSMRELNSALLNNAKGNLQYQLKVDSNNEAKEKSNCMNMNLPSSKFNLTSADVSKLNVEHQPNSIRLVKKPLKRPVSTMKNPIVTSVKRNIRMDSPNTSHLIPSTNVQFPQNNQSTNVPQLDNVHISSGSTMTKVQEQIKPQDRQEANVATNLLVQQPQHKLLQHHVKITNVNVQQQQEISKGQPVTRPRQTAHFLQRSVLPQTQPLQPDFGSNFLESNANVAQQPLFQQLQSNSRLTKVKVQQQKPQQRTNVRPANVNVSQSYSINIPRTSTQTSGLNAQHVSLGSSLATQTQSVRISSGQFNMNSSLPIQTSTSEQITPDQRDRQMRLIGVRSLTKTNPET